MTSVLIESDWNLKEEESILESINQEGINRIRLEFKVHMDYENGRFLIGINRIRLEFKGHNSH